MKGKLFLLAGLATGYVLGAKAGRQRYEQIKSTATKIWNSDSVQKPVSQAVEFAQTTAPELSQKLVDSTRKLVDTLVGKVEEIKAEAEKAAAAHEAGEKPEPRAASTRSTSTRSSSTRARSAAKTSTAKKSTSGS